MMRKRFGRVINITSVSGQMGNAGQTNYSASKAGQIGFTKALAREVASRNITVNAIAAGYVETEIWANVSEEIRQSIINIIPWVGKENQRRSPMRLPSWPLTRLPILLVRSWGLMAEWP